MLGSRAFTLIHLLAVCLVTASSRARNNAQVLVPGFEMNNRCSRFTAADAYYRRVTFAVQRTHPARHWRRNARQESSRCGLLFFFLRIYPTTRILRISRLCRLLNVDTRYRSGGQTADELALKQPRANTHVVSANAVTM